MIRHFDMKLLYNTISWDVMGIQRNWGYAAVTVTECYMNRELWYDEDICKMLSTSASDVNNQIFAEMHYCIRNKY